MNNNKGKAKAEPKQSLTPEERRHDSSLEPSFTSRLTASAQGLSRDAFVRGGQDATSDLASTLASTGKINPPSAASDFQGQGESSALSHIAGTSSKKLNNASTAGGFRSAQTEEYVERAENEFTEFLDGVERFQPSSVAVAGSDTAGFESAWRDSTEKRPFEAIGRTIVEQEQHDGEDVVALLAKPSSMEQFEPPEDQIEPYDWGLNDQQLAQLRSITQNLFPASSPHKAERKESLNLMHHMDCTTASILTGDSRPDDAWWEQWEGVLTRYADEVWGGLLPLVKEARKEMEEVGENEPVKEMPDAVRRLQSILGHLQKG